MWKESEIVELKSEVTSDLKKEVIAFANSYGGTIYIGISDNGDVVGVDEPRKIIEQVSRMIRDGIKPNISLHVRINEEEVSGKSVVVIKISEGSNKPYYLSDKGIKSSGVF